MFSWSVTIWHVLCTPDLSSCLSPSTDLREPKSLEYQGSQVFSVGSGCMHSGQYVVCEDEALNFITHELFREQAISFVYMKEWERGLHWVSAIVNVTHA